MRVRRLDGDSFQMYVGGQALTCPVDASLPDDSPATAINQPPLIVAAAATAGPAIGGMLYWFFG